MRWELGDWRSQLGNTKGSKNREFGSKGGGERERVEHTLRMPNKKAGIGIPALQLRLRLG